MRKLSMKFCEILRKETFIMVRCLSDLFYLIWFKEVISVGYLLSEFKAISIIFLENLRFLLAETLV